MSRKAAKSSVTYGDPESNIAVVALVLTGLPPTVIPVSCTAQFLAQQL